VNRDKVGVRPCDLPTGIPNPGEQGDVDCMIDEDAIPTAKAVRTSARLDRQFWARRPFTPRL